MQRALCRVLDAGEAYEEGALGQVHGEDSEHPDQSWPAKAALTWKDGGNERCLAAAATTAAAAIT